MDSLVEKYIKQLSEDEKKILEIATKQLKTSFNIKKSIGFINWLKVTNL
tara:strand:- start:416 stop:562 length:147 start_codon:yes stop_codon:yes gene_type:complete